MKWETIVAPKTHHTKPHLPQLLFYYLKYFHKKLIETPQYRQKIISLWRSIVWFTLFHYKHNRLTLKRIKHYIVSTYSCMVLIDYMIIFVYWIHVAIANCNRHGPYSNACTYANIHILKCSNVAIIINYIIILYAILRVYADRYLISVCPGVEQRAAAISALRQNSSILLYIKRNYIPPRTTPKTSLRHREKHPKSHPLLGGLGAERRHPHPRRLQKEKLCFNILLLPKMH